jgi:hypothetical protein
MNIEQPDCNIFVTGISGSGKTYLSEEWSKMGLKAYDADTIPGLAGWYTLDGAPCKYNPNADKPWFDTHRFLWSRKALESFLEKEGPVIVLGISKNSFDLMDCFDSCYFLQEPDEVLLEHLDSPRRINVFGSTVFQKWKVLRGARKVLKQALKQDMYILDGRMSAVELLHDIMHAESEKDSLE